MKKLSRQEMKNLNGGAGNQRPPGPSGAAGKLAPGGTGCYKCCRSNGVCSECAFSYSGATCPESGNTLTACSGC